LAVPDAYIDTVYPGIRALSSLMNSGRPCDGMITFSYPYSFHLIGYYAKRRWGIPWIADYGDPWTGNPLMTRRPQWRRRLDYYLEQLILRKADHVTVTTEATAQLYSVQFPFLDSRIRVVSMGYDPDDFDHVTTPLELTISHRVNLVYTGRLYALARNSTPFFTALASLNDRMPSLARKLRVFLVGEVERELLRFIQELCLNDLVQVVSWVDAETSYGWMSGADYLLLFGNRGGAQIPGKLCNYIGAGRPVLHIMGSSDDPATDIVTRLGLGRSVANEVNVIFDALVRIAKAELECGTRNPSLADAYRWAEQSRLMLSLFK